MIKKFLKLFGIFLVFILLAKFIYSLDGWQYSDLVIINNTQNPNNLTNYIALINLNTSILIQQGTMRPDCGDIRFTDSNGNLLNYWVEPGTCNTTNTLIWVEVPFVPGGSTEIIYLWYGNPNATSMSNVYSIFGNGLVTLYTFTECSGSVLHDYVGGINLTLSGLTWTSGFRQGICGLTGWTNGGLSSININGPNLGTGSFTVIAFIYPLSFTVSAQGIVGNYNSDSVSGWVLKLQQGNQFMLLTNQQGNWCQFAGGNLSTNNWYMIGAERNYNSLNYLYQNGILVASNCSGDTRNVNNNNGPFAIGTSYNNQNPFNGTISFIAIYNISLSNTVIQSLYNSLYVKPAPTQFNNYSY